LPTEQLDFADTHITLELMEDLRNLETGFPKGLVLLTGPEVEEERNKGLSLPLIDSLHALADRHRLPLLIEADGSRQKPLKAPADHEPVIPAWVDMVVVVCGLSGLGKPLDSEWVHRPELFAGLASLNSGDPITPEAVRRVMSSPIGGLKGIPAEAKRIALLNQADTEDQQASAHWLAEQLLTEYHSIIIASLNPPMPTSIMSILNKRDHSESLLSQKKLFDEIDHIFAVHEHVAGIILAAGGSNRMGKTKQVLPWQGEPFVRHVARTALAAGLSPVVVVTGSSAEDVESAVLGLPLSIVHNPNWETGQSSSVITGILAVPPETGAAIFLLSDQPQVPVELVRGLVETHAINLPPIVAPQVHGQRSNPVLFDRQVFPDLLSITGDVGGRILFSRFPVTWFPWYDSSLVLDVDTPKDYMSLLEIR